MGGSQGAEFFDNEISELMINLSKNYEISLIQQITDDRKNKLLKSKYIEKGIQNELFSFDEEIFKKYNQIDLAITRSGASTISELAFNESVKQTGGVAGMKQIGECHYISQSTFYAEIGPPNKTQTGPFFWELWGP